MGIGYQVFVDATNEINAIGLLVSELYGGVNELE